MVTNQVVYAIVSGEYSDYGVHAIYSTYAVANAEVERINKTAGRRWTARIETFLLDPTPETFDGQDGIEFRINVKGDPIETDSDHGPGIWDGGKNINPFAAPYEFQRWSDVSREVERYFVGYGPDAESARRAADEFRCMVLMAESPTN